MENQNNSSYSIPILQELTSTPYQHLDQNLPHNNNQGFDQNYNPLPQSYIQSIQQDIHTNQTYELNLPMIAEQEYSELQILPLDTHSLDTIAESNEELQTKLEKLNGRFTKAKYELYQVLSLLFSVISFIVALLYTNLFFNPIYPTSLSFVNFAINMWKAYIFYKADRCVRDRNFQGSCKIVSMFIMFMVVYALAHLSIAFFIFPIFYGQRNDAELIFSLFMEVIYGLYFKYTFKANRALEQIDGCQLLILDKYIQSSR